MPQYPHHPSWRVEGGAQVLDLETAVKDGVLGGGAVAGSLTSAEKVDLRKMVDDLEGSSDDVPSVFICPISLQPMVEPVTLCTGQTYDRGNILRWLSMGHRTCPTTMQDLWDDALTPNRTLHQLLYTWFSHRYLLLRKRSQDAHGCAADLISLLRTAKGQSRVAALRDLRHLAASQPSARRAVLELSGVALLSSLLGPLTSHAVGSEAVAILAQLHLDSDALGALMHPARVSLLVDMLNEGTPETRQHCVVLLQKLAADAGFRQEMLSGVGALVALMRVVRDRRHPAASAAALRLLGSLCTHAQLRRGVVGVGAVPQIVEILPGLPPECAESALCVLDALASLPEGVAALRGCAQTIPALVRVLMRVSEACTRCALNVLGELCRVSPEECAPAAVEAGLAAKLLLVLQSGCGPALKQRAAELLKLCSLNYSATHFMSKCKLTRTIQ